MLLTIDELKEIQKLPAEERIKIYCKRLGLSYPNRTFAASDTNMVKKQAKERNEQIVRHIIKCILMPENPDTVNHWVNEIVKEWIIPLSNYADKTGAKFSYTWFFTKYKIVDNGYDEHELKRLINNKIKKEENKKGELKYPNLKYKNSDIDLINDILLDIEEILELDYEENNEILNFNQVKEIIIECLS